MVLSCPDSAKPGGWFTMGRLEDDNYAKSPRRRIFVNEFFMDQTEITFRWQTSEHYPGKWSRGPAGTMEADPIGEADQCQLVQYDPWCNAASEMEGLTPVYYDTGGLVIRDGMERGMGQDGRWISPTHGSGMGEGGKGRK